MTSIVRLVLLIPLLADADQSWAVTYPVIWIGIEANLQVICAAAPTLRKFLRAVAPRLMGSEVEECQRPPTFSLRTFGQGNVRKAQYNKFGDLEDGTVLADEPDTLRPDVGPGQWSVRISRSVTPSKETMFEPGSDCGSGKAILQTQE